MIQALIENFNTNCYQKYTNVSKYLGNVLDEALKEIERFYYSEFWESRFKKINPIQLDIIQGMTSELRENTQFKLFDEGDANGVSNDGTMIALNTNLKNDSQIKNIIMHEFGHRQYNQPEFQIIVNLNKKVIGSPEQFIKDSEVLDREDYKYFVDHNEIRQRIIPIIKEMCDNNWTAEEAYELSENLKMDDIKDIFTKDYILYLLDNIL